MLDVYLRFSLRARVIGLSGDLTKNHIIVYKYINMKNLLRILKLLSDETRLRILMILTKKELCVCQIMAVLGISQPLVSRNLALLSDAGLLNERREGKLIFYSIRKDLPPFVARLIRLLTEELRDDEIMMIDVETLKDCYEYQKKSGKCDMKTFLAFMEERRKKRESRQGFRRVNRPTGT